MSTRREVTVENAGVTLTFFWTVDRYQHRLTSPGGQLEFCAWDEFSPPVFTEIHQQDELLFLSGNDTPRYWSASVEPVAGGFLFDIACRYSASCATPGGSYVGEGLLLETVENDGAKVEGSLIEACESCDAPPGTVRYRYRTAVLG